MYNGKIPHKRYQLTLDFLKRHINTSETILDLGIENPFSKVLKNNGFSVENTKGEDLDFNVSSVTNSNASVITAFEIFEHLLSPFTVLQAIKANKIIVSVPLRLWFSTAYRSKTDPWDRHYHEFEDWQLDWLLEKTGWKVIARKKWTNPTKKLGFRTILRWFTPRYYIVYAERA
ncbi:MAG: methyltransferase [Aestuariibaculum sp.]